MAGPVELQIRTEPSFRAAAALMGANPHILLARENATGHITGLGVRTERNLLLNEAPRRIGHLSFLRVAPAFRGKRDFLRQGFGLLRDLQRARPVDFCLTAILSGNYAARRLLEAGLPGLPVYSPIAEIATFTLGTRKEKSRSTAPPPSLPALNDFLQRHIEPMPLAPRIDLAEATNSNLTQHDFITVTHAGKIVAAATLWDQRAIRQTVITGYHGALRTFRPFYNTLQLLRGRHLLPSPGMLDLAYVSHLAIDPPAPQHFAALLHRLSAAAHARGIHYLALSLASNHPLCPFAHRIAMHRTESTLYTVHWPGEPVPRIPSTTPYVEAALL